MAPHTSLSGLQQCTATTFSFPTWAGAQVLSLRAEPVFNHSMWAYEGFWLNHGTLNVTGLDFCNVTVTYTHPGQNDTINTGVWLPSPSKWNGRLQAQGGGGFRTGLFILAEIGMAGSTAEGWATVSTDGGHYNDNTTEWALSGSGRVDIFALENFASVSLNEVSLIGKSVVQDFYGRPANYSYFNGCSTGGRQGYMIAQRYPKAFDGILASAPSLNFTNVQMAAFWPQAIMNELKVYPRSCELDAITAASVKACDGIDGLLDGIISDPDVCHFNANRAVNSSIFCEDTGTNLTISQAAADIANAAWNGPKSMTGEPLGLGINRGTKLTGWLSMVNTYCSGNQTNSSCYGSPMSYAADWIQLWVEKDPKFDLSTITTRNYEQTLRNSLKEYDAIIGTDDTDLSTFHAAGGKLLSYVGLSDQTVPPGYTRAYFNKVKARDASVNDYYRYFEAPGLDHCFGGGGLYPPNIFDSLVDWVENKKPPDTLDAQTSANKEGIRMRRRLCLYPKKSIYKGAGNASSVDSFYCGT